MQPSVDGRVSNLRVAIVVALLAMVVSGCGSSAASSALTASSSCSDYLALDETTRAQEAVRLSKVIGAQNPGNQLWAGNVAGFCGGNPSGDVASAYGRKTPDANTGSGEGADEEAPAVPPFEPKRVYNGGAELEDGSSFELKFEIGKRQPASKIPPEGFTDLASACAPDNQRDALIPIQLSVTSTNEGSFSQDISTGLEIGNINTPTNDLRFEIASSFGDGPQCTPAVADAFVQERVNFSDIAPGESDDHQMLVVIHNFYSPKRPNGLTAELAEVTAKTPGIPGSLLTCWSGPDGADGKFKLAGGKTGDEGSGDAPAC